MKKITIAQVRSIAKKEDFVTIQLFPSNCSPANTTWVKGFEVTIFHAEGQFIYAVNGETKTLESLVNEFSYYNCNSELGKKVHYYQVEDVTPLVVEEIAFDPFEEEPAQEEEIENTQIVDPSYSEHVFYLDGIAEEFKGITFGNYWNGWECPYFKMDECLKLLPVFNLDNDYMQIEYNQQDDAFYLNDFAYPEEPSIYHANMIDGEKYYPLGSWFLTWSKISLEDVIYNSDFTTIKDYLEHLYL